MTGFLDRFRHGLATLIGQQVGPESFADAPPEETTLAGKRPKAGLIAGRAALAFAPLARAEPGLDRQAARYVAAGEGGTVISLAARPQAQTAWSNANNHWPRRDTNRLFASDTDWSATQIVRLGEVVAALEPIRYGWGYFGTGKSPDWLRHAATMWLGDKRKRPIADLAAIAAAGGAPVAAVLDVLLSRDAASYGQGNSVDRFTGTADWLVAHRDPVAAALPALGADERAEFAAATGRLGIADAFLDALIDLAAGTSKKAAATARAALTAVADETLAARLADRYPALAPTARVALVDLVSGALADPAPLLARWLEGETAPRVRAAIERVTEARPTETDDAGDDDDGYVALDGRRIALPPLVAAPPPTAIPDATMALLAPAAAAFNAKLDAGKAEAVSGSWHWTRQFARVDAARLAALRRLGEGSGAVRQDAQATMGWIRHLDTGHPGIAAFFDDPGLSLRHAVRFAVASANGYFLSIGNGWAGPAAAALAWRMAAGADMRTVLALWVEAGGRDPIVDHLGAPWYQPLADPPERLWEVVAARLDLLDEALGMRPQSGAQARAVRPALELMALLPAVPRRYQPALMALASGTGTTLRSMARALLRDAPGIDEAIAGLLGDGRQEVRAGAAEWLAQRDARGQVPALRRALGKERSELARAAIITALERLGDDVDDLFDPATMLREAEAGLAKARPKGLDWFPFERLPALAWRDGAAIDPLVVRWWVVLAAKLKQPGGNALFDLWLDRLAPGDAHRLGWTVLTGWIAHDTLTCTEEEASAHAAAHVAAALQTNRTHIQRWPDAAAWISVDRDTVFAQLKGIKLGTYLASGADTKGVLGLATRVEGADAARVARAYLKDHGARAAQAKALVDTLAANPARAALQVLLAAANRSKQRSVQAHAAALVEAVAERRGWSTDELADRTVPTAGMDADAALEVDCGPGRLYALRLDEADAVVLLNPDGAAVKALPGPRGDGEKPAIDAAKALVSAARKEVKQVFAAQAERLREAMLTGRHWRREDWESFVAGHPLVGRLARRLVWLGVDEAGATVATFRPLGDGTLTDADDAEVGLAEVAEVRLAHASLLDDAAIAAWRRHLADYEVAAPFDQVGRALPMLDPDADRATDIRDREGWMIETFALRGAATRLGYQRGPAEDGGWFSFYARTYRSAGLVAEIEFSGSPLPEENAPAALHALSFRTLRANGMHGRPLALADVPPVLLAESWQDLHDIAAKGSGFDPDWQKKVH